MIKTNLLLIFTLLLSFFCISQSEKEISLAESNKDVLILTLLIQEHLRETKERATTLEEILMSDTLYRITNNFEKIDFILHGGCITVQYTFKDSRNSSLELNENEKEIAKHINWKAKKVKDECNGEIQFDYGEDHYRVKKIIDRS